MDQCEKPIHAAAVARRTNLVNHRMHEHGGRYSGQNKPLLLILRAFDNCQNAMLTAVRVPSLAHDREDLAG
jgi:hypothetical protein